MPDSLRSITTSPFPADEIEEQMHGVFLSLEMMHRHLPVEADATPSAGQAERAEQRRFDRKRVVARHVPGGVRAFDIELVRLNEHGPRIADRGNPVQRQF